MTHGPCARPGIRLCLLALACVLATGCLGKPAPRDRYFRLELAPPVPLAAPALAGVLEVDRLRANIVVRRTALVYVTEHSAPDLRTRRYEHWADSPTLLVQREIASYLRAARIAGRVATPELGVAADHRLSGDLLRFEEQHGADPPRVVIEIAFTLSDEQRREILLQETYLEERAVEGPAAEDAVRAYDAALAAALARLVADIGAQP